MINQDILIKEWIKQYNTKNSQDAAAKTINQFSKYLGKNSLSITDYINAISLNEKEKFRHINNFLNSLSISPASIRQYYSFFKSYLRVIHGIKIDIEDRRQFIKFPPIPKINRFSITKEIIKELCKNSDQIHRTFFLIQSSSGMRISESLNLKKENFDFTSNPIKITIPAKLTKTQTERIAFISKEALSNLQRVIVEYFQEKTLNNYEQYFYQLRKRLGYIEKYDNSINYKINIHSLRAFFRTTAIKSNIHQDLAESLIGHSGYLTTYKRIEEIDLIAAYKKIEPKLRIF